MPTTNKPAIQPEWYAICFDETKCWIIDEADRPLIEKMIGVYIVDRSVHTYCCEITPSNYLRHVYNDMGFHPGVAEEDRERLREKYIDESREDTSTYMWVSHLDRYIEKNPKMVYKYPIDPDDLEAEDRGEEDTFESCQGNCPF